MSERPDAATILRILKLAERFAATADCAALSDRCEKCKGRGWHHGFGEDGNDPDWCDTCGGGGLIVNRQRYDAAMAEFIASKLAESAMP